MYENKINVVDLFSGCGGLSFGFHKSKKFKILFANEIDVQIASTYSENFPNTKMYVENITNISKTRILNDFKFKDIKVDLVIGGPPCQAFSTLGKRDIKDKRVLLFKEYLRLVDEFKPKVFIFENVKGLISMDKGKVFENIINEANKIAYNISYKVINALDYGIPQVRKRIFIFGVNKNYQFSIEKIWNSLNNCKKNEQVSLRDAIGDLPPVSINNELNKKYFCPPFTKYQKHLRTNLKFLTEHNASKYSEKLLTIMLNLTEGQTPRDLPIEIKPNSGYSNTYSRLWWDKPAHTITRNFTVPSSSRCIHPKENRALTIREGARIQSFPDNFIFKGSLTSKRLQIGNAVPPLLSLMLAKIIAEQLVNNIEYKN